MDEQYLEARFATSAERWRERLHRAKLDRIVGAFLEAAEPLSVLGAQVLYVSQPVLGLMVQRQVIKDWANLLETPGGLAWFRDQLLETETQAEHMAEGQDHIG
jgi:hypothetical protein